MVEDKNREGSADEERRLKTCWPGFIEYRKKECGEAARYPISPTTIIETLRWKYLSLSMRGLFLFLK
jgi:hypothetical protein